MADETKEKDNFVLYIVIITAIIISAILVIKSSENDKFAPIKAQVAEELRLMNVRVLN